jgi:hypothetical protein
MNFAVATSGGFASVLRTRSLIQRCLPGFAGLPGAESRSSLKARIVPNFDLGRAAASLGRELPMAADFESLDFLYMPSSDVARDLASEKG